ncbi:MAG: hypothetical protein WBP59_12700, partial [Ilumatobacteraceae bacterium]
LNYSAGQVQGNGAVAPLDANGRLCLYSYASSDVVVDIVGWFTAGPTTVTSAFVPAVPRRLVDTRNGTGAPKAKVTPSTPLEIAVTGTQLTVDGVAVSVPASAEAIAMNLTVVGPSTSGYATVWPCGTSRPTTSSLNYAAGATVGNNVVAPIGANGKVCLYTYANANFVVDVTGWIVDGTAYSGSTPDRVIDTRFGIGPRPA